MFRVKLHFFSIVVQADIRNHLSLRIKKDHWHYLLLEQIEGQQLNFQHQLDLLEDENSNSSFELQLVSKIQGNKAILYGSTTIKLLEWPLQRPKRQKIKLSPGVWIELQLSYEYLPFIEASSSLEDELPDIELNQQVVEAEDENKFLKLRLKELQDQYNNLSAANRLLEQRKLSLGEQRMSYEREIHQQQEKVENERQELTTSLQKTNYVLTSLMNLVIGKANVATIAAVNLILESDNK